MLGPASVWPTANLIHDETMILEVLVSAQGISAASALWDPVVCHSRSIEQALLLLSAKLVKQRKNSLGVDHWFGKIVVEKLLHASFDEYARSLAMLGR